MKKLTPFVAIALLNTGCASTESTFNQYNSQAVKIKPSKEVPYEVKHAELAQSMGVVQQSLESAYGKIYAFAQGGFDSRPSVGKSFLTTAENLFKSSCKGEIYSLNRFEEDAYDGKLNPLYYATEEEIELMSKYSVSSTSYSVTEKEFKNYLALSYSAMLNRQQEENRDSIADYTTPFVRSIDFASKGIILPRGSIVTLSPGTNACYIDGKMAGVQIFFSIYVDKNEVGHTSLNARTYTLTSLYLPAETIDAFIKNAFKTRLENVARQAQIEENRAARKASQIEERAKIERTIAQHDATLRQNWNDRFDTVFNVGDGVCTPANKVGFVEQVNGNNIKVWFKGRLSRENRNYFFGNSQKLPNSKFTYESINDLTWVKRGDIASCEFNLNL